MDVDERRQQDRRTKLLHVRVRMRNQDFSARTHGDDLAVMDSHRSTAQRCRADRKHVVGGVDLGHASPPAASISVVASSGPSSSSPLRFSTKSAT